MNKKVMLVLAIVLMSVMNVKAQGLAEMPSTSFRSTSSSMYQSGSNLPSAAASGVMMADDSYGYNSQARQANIRKGRPGDEGDPTESEPAEPIGDGLLVLLVMAVGFAGVRGWRRSLLRSDRK